MKHFVKHARPGETQRAKEPPMPIELKSAQIHSENPPKRRYFVNEAASCLRWQGSTWVRPGFDLGSTWVRPGFVHDVSWAFSGVQARLCFARFRANSQSLDDHMHAESVPYPLQSMPPMGFGSDRSAHCLLRLGCDPRDSRSGASAWLLSPCCKRPLRECRPSAVRLPETACETLLWMA